MSQMQPWQQQPGMLATNQRTNSAEVAVAWVLTVLSGGYFLPWAIAATRGKANSGAIAVVDLLLGWTVVGWVVALVMACGPHQVAGSQVVVNVNATGQQYLAPNPPSAAPQQFLPAAPGWYADANGVQRWWDGANWTQHTPQPPAPMQSSPPAIAAQSEGEAPRPA